MTGTLLIIIIFFAVLLFSELPGLNGSAVSLIAFANSSPPPRAPSRAGTVIIAVHGFAVGWQAGEPLISLSFRHHLLAPLVRDHEAVHVLFCVERALAEGDLTAIRSEGAGRVEQYVHDSSKYGRRGECFLRALQEYGAPDWWVAMRTDMLFYEDFPSLHTLSRAAIHTRTRFVRWDKAILSTAHFSYGSECVEECPPPCPLFLKPFVVADDLFGIIPHGALASAYFNESIDSSMAYREAAGCAGIFHPNLAEVWAPHLHYSKKREDFFDLAEHLITCAVVALGGIFEPLGLAARVNPYARDPQNHFGLMSESWGVNGVMIWPTKEDRDCSGGAGGSVLG